MSLQEKPYYWIECDYPGCHASSSDHSDYSAWSDSGMATDLAIDSGWYSDKLGDFCEQHVEVDEETEELTPKAVPA